MILSAFKNYLNNLDVFDIKTPDDLYTFFLICHLFSWSVLLWKLGGKFPKILDRCMLRYLFNFFVDCTCLRCCQSQIVLIISFLLFADD